MKAYHSGKRQKLWGVRKEQLRVDKWRAKGSITGNFSWNSWFFWWIMAFFNGFSAWASHI